MKKLNNKGFTLIELLAVIVILVVVMGVVVSPMLSSMNKSKKNSLESSASGLANALNNKYADAMLTDGDVYGIPNISNCSATEVCVYEMNANESLNLLDKNYELGTTITPIKKNASSEYVTSKSVVLFNGSTFAACLVADPNGGYYLANAAGKNSKATVLKGKIEFEKVDDNALMWACSNGEHSWID